MASRQDQGPRGSELSFGVPWPDCSHPLRIEPSSQARKPPPHRSAQPGQAAPAKCAGWRSGGRHSPPHLPVNLLPQTSTTRLCSSSHPSKFSVCPPCSGPTRLTRMGDTNTSLHPGASHWLRLAGAPAGARGRAGRSQPGSRHPGLIKLEACLRAYIRHLRRGPWCPERENDLSELTQRVGG